MAIKLSIFFLLFSQAFAQSELEFIKKNYEYNIVIIENFFKSQGIELNLQEKDKTIDLTKLRSVRIPSVLAEVGNQTGVSLKDFKAQISSLEKKIFELFPRQGYYVGYCAFLTRSKLNLHFHDRKNTGGHIDESDPHIDSFKHTYWSYLISTRINSEFAKLWFTARELKRMNSGLTDLSLNPINFMDMLNNLTGFKLSKMSIFMSYKLTAIIDQKFKNGELFFHQNGEVLRTSLLLP